MSAERPRSDREILARLAMEADAEVERISVELEPIAFRYHELMRTRQMKRAWAAQLLEALHNKP